MKAVVTELFADKNDNSYYHVVGSIVDFDEERIKDLADRQLVKVIEAETVAKPKRVTKKK